MKRLMRCFLVLVFVIALAPAAKASAAEPPADPVCAQVATALGATYESIWLDGAVTCVMYPARWNRDMVVFAHGYEDARQAIGIPWAQLNLTTPSLPELILKLGYAFGTTSYSKNGLAVKEGVNDVVALVQHVRQVKFGLRRVFLTGASEGGAVTALAVEKFPSLFAGALSTCGPIGSFQKQVQYWGDFRVAFDSYFPDALLNLSVPDPLTGMLVPAPSTPIAINPLVVANWELIRDGIIVPMLADPLAAPKVQELLAKTGVPIDPANPITTAGESILGLLYYNVESTNDGRMTLVPGAMIDPPSLQGNPYNNPGYITPFYPLGITPDPAAIAEINAYYETSGKLRRQLVVMHTTGDPIIPFEQSLLYTKKVASQGALGRLALIPINRYGHCQFTAPEILFGFYVMVLRSTLIPFSPSQIQSALPEKQAQAEFNRMKNTFNDRTGWDERYRGH